MKKIGYIVTGSILTAALLSGCGGFGNATSPQTSEQQQISAQAETQSPETLTQSITETQEQNQTATEPQATDAAAEVQADTSSGGITEEEAKKIAFADAGIQESDVTGVRVRKEIDDGIEEYEVDFYVGNTEYDYDIDASTGTIRSKDLDIDDDFDRQAADGTTISESEAIAIVLERLPQAQESDIRMELDWDDGKRVYEGSVYPNGEPEYEFEIDASTGKILSWEQD